MRWLLACAAAVLLASPVFSQDGMPPGGGSHLGIRLHEIDADRASALKLGEPRGVEVKAVQPESPADKAGLRAGDVLLTYNTEEILSGPQLGRLVNETPPGRKVKIQYWREGKTHTVVIAPAAGAALQADDSPPQPLDPRAAMMVVPRVVVVWENLALGIVCEPIDSQLAEFFGVPNGILVRGVAKGMAGDRAGLKAGDVITSVDTRVVNQPKDLISYLRTHEEPGKSLAIRIVREHKPRTLTLPIQ